MKGLTQVRYVAKCIVDTGRKRPGDAEWVTVARAREMINARIATLVADEAPKAGPSETKPAGPTEKKTSSVTGTAGPSTALPKSSASGKVAQSLSSLAVRASRLIKWPASRLFGGRGKTSA